jgi:hypothetical protein
MFELPVCKVEMALFSDVSDEKPWGGDDRNQLGEACPARPKIEKILTSFRGEWGGYKRL